MNKILSIIGIFAVCSLALGFAGGDGTASNPYQIATEADLLDVNNDTSASYILVNDIDLTGTYTDSLISAGEGSYYANFTGSYFDGDFDGNGYVIRNLVINATGSTNVGLFGLMQFGTIKNLGIEDFDITSDGDMVGVLTARCLDSTISDSYVSGTPNSVSGNKFVGGITGLINDASTVTDCWADADVTGSGERVGGFAGQQSGNISNCYALGDVECTLGGGQNNVGGFVGYENGGTITNSHAAGSVTGQNQRIGGFTGYSAGGTFTNCYATGDVNYTGTATGIINVGGFIGQSSAAIDNCYSAGDVNAAGVDRIGGFAGFISGVVTNCYATGDVTAGGTVGGLVGISLGEIYSSYATGTVSGSSNVGGFLGQRYQNGPIYGVWDIETSGTTTGIGTGGNGGGDVTGKTTAEMKTQQTFTDRGWDFENIWFMPQFTTAEVPGYPVFQYQVEYSDADLNKDGIVDLIDFSILAGGWLSEAF
jgi:hypothetical protein